MVVVPGEPLSQMEVLAFDGVSWVEEDVEAPVLQGIVELLDLPVVLGVVGFVPDVGDPCESTGSSEACAPLSPTVCPNGTNEEGGMGDDVVEELNGTFLITVL